MCPKNRALSQRESFFFRMNPSWSTRTWFPDAFPSKFVAATVEKSVHTLTSQLQCAFFVVMFFQRPTCLLFSLAFKILYYTYSRRILNRIFNALQALSQPNRVFVKTHRQVRPPVHPHSSKPAIHFSITFWYLIPNFWLADSQVARKPGRRRCSPSCRQYRQNVDQRISSRLATNRGP